MNKILIPLPPLEEQRRIVDILDRFDKLCNDISEGLPAEIEARQKQYEYFREKLLTFKKYKWLKFLEGEMSSVDYNMLISTLESTVVTEYVKEDTPVYTYQSEADLEREFIKNLQNQGYEYLIIHNEKELIANLRVN